MHYGNPAEVWPIIVWPLDQNTGKPVNTITTPNRSDSSFASHPTGLNHYSIGSNGKYEVAVNSDQNLLYLGSYDVNNNPILEVVHLNANGDPDLRIPPITCPFPNDSDLSMYPW